MTTPTRRAWPLWLMSVLMIVAIGISAYMSRHHEIELYGGEEYASAELVGCAETEGVSCDIVNTSAWSEVMGVPTFTWGAITYLSLLILTFMALRGRHDTKPLMFGVGIASTLFSAWLYYISVYELGYVCLYCMRLYVINLAIPVLIFLSGMTKQDLPPLKSMGTYMGIFAAFTGATIGIQKAYRASLLEGAPEIRDIADASEIIAQQEEENFVKDPEGPAPALTFDIVTEDGNNSSISIQPDDPWKGNPQAKVAVVEFADFQCGYCKRAGFEIHRLFEAYKDDVVFVYKHFPMDPKCNPGVRNPKHPYACTAHAASVCAQKQGYFWAYHDLLYKNNHQLRAKNLLSYADKVGMDVEAFRNCMVAKEGEAKVYATGEEGKQADIHGTPRIYINGKLYRAGSSAQQMAVEIEQALGRTRAEAVANTTSLQERNQAPKAIPADIPEMQRIQYGELDFYIDTFEASLKEGKAFSGKREIPGLQMSWYAANDACQAAGKRMCSEEEWIAACQSKAPADDDNDGFFADDMIEGNAYPYGDFHSRRMCWEDHALPRGTPSGTPNRFRPVYTGEMPGCVTPDGVYDLTGNAEEWVGSTAETAVLLGGAYDTPDDKARCYRRNDTFGAGYANHRTGFRCCKNAN